MWLMWSPRVPTSAVCCCSSVAVVSPTMGGIYMSTCIMWQLIFHSIFYRIYTHINLSVGYNLLALISWTTMSIFRYIHMYRYTWYSFREVITSAYTDDGDDVYVTHQTKEWQTNRLILCIQYIVSSMDMCICFLYLGLLLISRFCPVVIIENVAINLHNKYILYI